MLRYLALATDYDGTIAHDGRVEDSTVKALERLKESDRRVVLVTGRTLGDLERVFPHLDLFDRVVAENGLVIHRPRSKETVDLAGSPREELLDALRARDVPFRVGHSIIGLDRPHEVAALEAIRDVGLELQIVFNKESVMIVPSGHNKATGMLVALRELRLSQHNVVGIGDAENDHAFLTVCECSVATANAVETLKERCDHVTSGERGAGVEELIEAVLDDDLHSMRLARRRIVIGERSDDQGPVWFEPHDRNVLVAGPSGSGKSSATTSIIERLADASYQFLLIDPEGDYENMEGAVVLGDQQHAPSQSEILAILENPDNNVVVNLLDVPLADRPAYFDGLMGRLAEVRASTGRPHWIVIDEAHHLLPAERGAGASTLPAESTNLIMITVHPERMAPAALEVVDALLAVGPNPRETIEAFAGAIKEEPPEGVPEDQQGGRAVAWLRRDGDVLPFKVAPARLDRRRHRRKYAEGELKPERSFWFTGPGERLNIRAQNLQLFVQIGDGLDDETWAHHLESGDYERWFREVIKDDDLAATAVRLREDDAGPGEARDRLREAIERAYTLPA
jgi:hydroxymethylpyrimidine pyrophosphatase-like HAD family hydrolase